MVKFCDDTLKDTGSGCMVFSIKDTMAEHEMCFGESVK